jgi:hypothetical protein
LSDRDLAAALGYATDGGIVDALFGDVTIPARVNQNIARQVQRSRQAFARPPIAQGARGAIDYAAGITMPIPIIGDVLGFSSDVARMRAEPEERTAMNMGMAALGLLPFIPSRLLAAKNKLLTDNRLKKEQNFYGYPDKTSKGILVMMPPQQFLQMAVDGGSDVKRRASQMKQFDVEKYNQEFLPNLTLDRAKGQIVEHEGRARAMRALMDKVTEIPVVISSRGKRFSDIDELPSVVKREHTGEPVSLRDTVPLELLLRQNFKQPTLVDYIDPFRDTTR